MIINYLTKIVYCKLVKVIINILGLAKVTTNIAVCHHNIFKSIITN